MYSDKPVLAIGDVHGHLDRLEALLKQEGIIGDCPACGGTGDTVTPTDGPIAIYEKMTSYPEEFCKPCDGTGIARINHDVVVVQLGDLGHFGYETHGADELAWKFGPDWVDYVLWGNHDRAVLDRWHAFSGFDPPLPNIVQRMVYLREEGRLKLAVAAHGFLLTHAGLHNQFKYNEVKEELKTSPSAFAAWMNEMDIGAHEHESAFRGIRDSIGKSRGGASQVGGILWRDATEKLYPWRQVFGHSRGDKVRTYQSKLCDDSYCVDVGDQFNGRLAGIWLPDERIVEVKLEADWEKASQEVADILEKHNAG